MKGVIDMHRVCILGANGYIARNLIKILEKRKDIELFTYDKDKEQKDGCKFYEQIDALESNGFDKIYMDCDVIFLMIGKTGSEDGFSHYDSFIDVNEKVLLNFLNSYVKKGSKAKIIFPSTRLIYKGSKELLTEQSAKEFKTVYAMTKFSCEQYLEMFHRVYGIDYCIFRICIPYGTIVEGAGSYGTAEFMLKKATAGENITLYGDGTQRRSIIHITDLCNYLIEGALCETCINDVYNIGGENYSLKEMAQFIADKYSVSVEYVEWPKTARKLESGSTVFDSSKLDTILQENTPFVTGHFQQWIHNELICNTK